MVTLCSRCIMVCEVLERGAVQAARVSRLQRALLLLSTAACITSIVLYMTQLETAKQHPHQAAPETTVPQWSWTWICTNGRCERLPASDAVKLQSLSTCNMLCGSTQLWPQPTGVINLATDIVPVHVDGFTLRIITSPSENVSQHLVDAFILLISDLERIERNKKRSNITNLHTVAVQVTIEGSGDPRMRLNTDESYRLTLQARKNVRNNARNILVKISAQSFCGARHGFETLSQLVWLDPYAESLMMFKAATVTDAPVFKYRGLLLDTARNYIPVEDILRTIDAMAASKLNTFHWHATDSSSFPLKLNSVPQLAQHGAYGQGAVYTTQDIKTIVRRARLRGIRVLIEVDTPAHVGRAWSWGLEAGFGQLALCVEAKPWYNFCWDPPCGQLNPRNPHVYKLLELIYDEIIQLTGVDDVFHLGGDEVSEKCWNEHFKETSHMDLWLEFTKFALTSLEQANGGILPELTLLWSSPLTHKCSNRLNESSLGIQLWHANGTIESNATLNSNFRTVISAVNAWYLDCGFGSWKDSEVSHCKYNSWQKMYEYRPWAANKMHNIDGGEACMWTEQLGPGGLDARIWPRAAAMAERLWSDRAEGAAADVYLRLDTQRSRLVARGVRAAPLWPRWCSHNPRTCI